ncbi:hypothetical protein N7519_005033 [Penicillium mononematosum]|uniref:uncharacterized protein n=1 Tax=Penicillium mononematosum TaxID=268346 RepID=UPI0025469222|nr:uncharacterized protein N7519_005033 [Penicillium mononematosum]KAJ6183732.1 hypothetical protein N7519_005033 [Penicillium mononematosum]
MNNLSSSMKSPPSHSLLFLLLIASTVAMLTTRYTVPIPESMNVLETRRELNEMAEHYPLSTVGARNGGWYILDHDGTVLAVATDSVCEELDASIEEAMRLYGLVRKPDNDVSESVAPRSDQRSGSEISNTCSHPRCLASSACRTYSDCYSTHLLWRQYERPLNHLG